jgi:hypothetical protein
MGAGWIHRPLTGATLFTGFVAALSSSDGCFTPDFAFGKIIFNGLVLFFTGTFARVDDQIWQV